MPVVRRKDDQRPYIPGSSLKGKIRCLLEQVRGENGDSQSRNNGGDVCELFGASESSDKKHGSVPSRLIVRDADFSNAAVFKNSQHTDMPFTEVKFENTIDRKKGTALSPRQQERIPAGAEFSLEFILNIFATNATESGKTQQRYETLLNEGISLLNSDYLGGSGSRGYGHVKIELVEKKTTDIFKQSV